MAILEKYGKISAHQNNNLIGNEKNVEVNFVVEGENLLSMTKTAGLACLEYGIQLSSIKPHLLFVVGDRFETLPICMAASYQNIPVAHLEGGEASGSIDDKIRYAITKLADFHFVCSKEAAVRLKKIGENKKRIFLVGSTSFDVLQEYKNSSLNNFLEFQKKFGTGDILNLQKNNFFLVIYHPVTTEYFKNYENTKKIIKSILRFDKNIIWIMPNMDAGSDGVSKAIREMKEDVRSKNIHFFKSLSIEYLSPLLKNCSCIIGNSSTGIRESSFLGIPSVNIGNRQRGRQQGKNVINVDYSETKIFNAIKIQMNKKFKSSKLYGDGKACVKIRNIINKIDINLKKGNSF